MRTVAFYDAQFTQRIGMRLRPRQTYAPSIGFY